jgi:adenine-specific DNA-methyltransferase
MNDPHPHDLPDLGFSPDAAAQRRAELLALLAQAAPEVMSDSQIDLDKLKELLGQERIAEPKEHYELSWAGKAAARREIQKTSSHTLLPSSSNPPNAPHMLIEGENLEVLRVLQKSYYGKVKMIYIDPPYNTGNDSFVYPDDYSETLAEYQKRTGEKNEAGYLNKQSLWKKNSKESGQYHSAWLSMMYPRLYLARNLLDKDGVIFISIDDNEVQNLRHLMDEIFGEENALLPFIWSLPRGINAGQITRAHEYVLGYAKNKNLLKRFERQEPEYSIERCNKKIDKRHPASIVRFPAGIRYEGANKVLTGKLPGTEGVEIFGSMILSDGLLQQDVEVKAGWTMKDMIESWLADRSKPVSDTKGQLIEEFFFKENGKLYSRKLLSNESPKSILLDIPDTQVGREHLAELLGADIFEYPKPYQLVERLAKLVTTPDSLCLDFFAGSGTTAHAVMKLNSEDGGNRQCISVQMPEVLEESSEAYKAGYRTIADITRARIDKVIAKLKAENPLTTQDLACAHFTLAPSNFKVWRGDVAGADALREQLSIFQTAEKAKAVDAQTAMLAELLLKTGQGALGVHAIAKPKVIAGTTVQRVLMPQGAGDDKEMWLCFEPYTPALKDEIAKAKPAKVLMLNSCFVGEKADEQLANLQLELAGLDIGLTVI